MKMTVIWRWSKAQEITKVNRLNPLRAIKQLAISAQTEVIKPHKRPSNTDLHCHPRRHGFEKPGQLGLLDCVTAYSHWNPSPPPLRAKNGL